MPKLSKIDHYFISKCLLVLLLALIYPSVAISQAYNSTTLSNNLLDKLNSPEDLTATTLVLRNRLLGVVTVKINKLSYFNRKIITDQTDSGSEGIYLGNATVKLQRGIPTSSKSRTVRASLSSTFNTQDKTDPWPYLRIRFTKERAAGRVFEITHYFNSKKNILRHVNLRALSQKSCDLDNLVRKSVKSDSTQQIIRTERALQTTAASLKVFTVATDCDLECYNALGKSNANNRIAEFFNSASNYYKNDFSFDLSITSQTVRTLSSTYNPTLTDSSNLLDRFTTVASSLPSADFKHLITGKNIKEDVVGLSYLGVVCSEPKYSLGFSEHFNSLLTPIIIAHELGHNFGADHDPKPSTGAEQGIMTEVLDSPLPSAFSSLSKNMINAHINALGSKACYDSTDDTTGNNPPAVSYDAELSAKFSRTTFTASILQNSGSNCSIQLHASSKESNLFSQSTLVLTNSIEPKISQKIRVTNLKKVLLANSSKTARPYFGIKSVCDEGIGYSQPARLNVGIVNSPNVNKDKTVRNLKQWIAEFKSNIGS